MLNYQRVLQQIGEIRGYPKLAIFIGKKTMINYQKFGHTLFSDLYTNVEFWYTAGYTDGVI